MSESPNRRQFLGAAAAAGVAFSARPASAIYDPLIVGVMGMGGRGTTLAKTFAQQPGTRVDYVCDVDKDRAGKAAEEVGKVGKTAPKALQDFRKILDDKAVDVLVIATCNHWHAPAAILGCAAGKHVYVEKPCSHNAREGELMVDAARKYNRKVQLGTQRRSWPTIMEGIEQVRKGAIGRAYFAQAWYTNNRPSIGKGKEGQAPEGLDYDLWQGPAPKRSFHTNYLHYNWHWFWHWGNGELGNNGVHMIDVCRWGLGVDYPHTVSSSGGRYRFDDDQETPDTNVVTFTFEGKKAITWEGLSCIQLPAGKATDAIFHGEDGTLAIQGGGYSIHDPKGKEVKKVPGPAGDATHIANFLAAVCDGKPLNAEIEEGHKSTLCCHLGNIAYRRGRSLKCDPKNGHILEDKEAMGLWTREYDKAWQERIETAVDKKIS